MGTRDGVQACALAAQLTDVLRPEDTVARLGVDELAVDGPVTSADDTVG